MKYGMNPDGATMPEKLGIPDERMTEIADMVKKLYDEHAYDMKQGKGLVPFFTALLDNFQGVELLWASMGSVALMQQDMDPLVRLGAIIGKDISNH